MCGGDHQYFWFDIEIDATAQKYDDQYHHKDDPKPLRKCELLWVQHLERFAAVCRYTKIMPQLRLYNLGLISLALTLSAFELGRECQPIGRIDHDRLIDYLVD